MSYLISQFGWYLLAAFIIGLITGWQTCSRERRQWGWLPVGLLVALVALLLTWFRVINGVTALWVETALLLFAMFLLGCCLGCLFRQGFMGEVADGVRGWHGNLGAAGPGLGGIGAEMPSAVRDWHSNLGVAVPAAAFVAPAAAPEPAPQTTVIMPRPAAAAPKVPEPAAMQKVEGEDMIAGKRPLGLVAPRGGKSDDLKLIRGIGKQNEGRLHGLGIWHFDQIAQWSKDNALWVGSYLAFPGRIEREEWISQANDLASGKETAFAARVKRGEVATSKDDGSLGQGNVASVPSSNPKTPKGGKT
jgi:predicted flap endonuclease-1-like 5' DNA nuclease